MPATPELAYLTLVIVATLLMWIPYVLARIQVRGLMGALGYPRPGEAAEPAWALRARLAHTNAVENLVTFAPLVICVSALGLSSPGTALAARVYLFARLVHYAVYTAGIPVARTLAFLAGAGSSLYLALVLTGIVH